MVNEYKHVLLVHPSSIDDIQRDKDVMRREISLSRIRKYHLLEEPPRPSSKDLEKYKLLHSTENDRVDNEILFAIFKDAANILISEDRKIHIKAARLGIKDRVHYLQQAVEFLNRLHVVSPAHLPNIRESRLYQIDLEDSFFDSLREDYPDEFDAWFKEKARGGRKAWVYRGGAGQLGALCIYNIETEPRVTNDNRAIPGKVLKLCTFKVGEAVRGRRIGELFLKTAFRFATDNNIEHIYLHTRPGKQDFLIDFCKEFGFYYFGEYKKDHVYLKDHPAHPPISDLPPLDYHRMYYPHFKAGPAIGKFIVPIKPKYHKILFPDEQKQLLLFSHTEDGKDQVVGNAMRQAYLCHARIGGITPSSILLFYRSTDLKMITSIGIVEQAGDHQDIDKIMQLVAKRTVYSHSEIDHMAKKKTKVLLFRIAAHLSQRIPFNWLQKHGIVNGNIQTIRRISDDSFGKVAEEWGVPYYIYAD